MLQAFSECPQAQVVACSILKDEDGKFSELNPRWKIASPVLHSYKEWCTQAILGKMNVTVWNKLYRAGLLKDVRFREGRVVEDVFFAYDLLPIVRAEQVDLLVIPDFLYHYRIRQGSICHNETPILPESIRCRTEIARECRESEPELARRLQQMVQQEVMAFNRMLDTNEAWRKRYASTYRPMMKEIHLSDIRGFDLPARGKTALVIQRYFPILFPPARRVWETFKRIKGKIIS